MERHPTDYVELLFGLAFLAVTVVNRPRAGAGEPPLERVVTPGEPSETSETREPGEESQTEWPSNT